jgi:glycosyltransferase involved in cell wall biosynthesis
MHILFVHRNFPAQFGHIAAALIEQGHDCTFISEREPGITSGIQKIQYRVAGGAVQSTHYCSRTFENAIWHAAGVYETLKLHRTKLFPDLIVGHSGFGSTLFLGELFPETPIINYFEYFYHPHNSDLDFRPEWPPLEYDRLRSHARNAMILLDLANCQAGYTPTNYQKNLFPVEFHPKLSVIHDGIDTTFWQREQPTPRQVGNLVIPENTQVITYVSRGLEAMRGFDIFMQIAQRICEYKKDVIFLIVGSEKVAYGGDMKHISAPSFKEYVLSKDNYDLDRYHFLGYLSPEKLRLVFSVSDLHIYLTAPFVLSWSLLNAMACGCAVLASNTEPVLEVIHNSENGLLCDFFDIDGFVQSALDVLNDPPEYRKTLGKAAANLIQQRYSLDVNLPKLLDLFNRHATARN